MRRGLKYILTIWVVANLALPVYAEGIHVSNSGNGEGSDNSISVSFDLDTDVEQSNQTDIETDVDVSADTGGNSAGGNVGEVDIETGNVSSETAVENEGSENSAATQPPSVDGVEISNEGNGAGSDNEVEFIQESDTSIDQVNDVVIVNSVTKELNTGDNEAEDNVGEVRISTGDITDETTMLNRVGVNDPTILAFNVGDVLLSNQGNGADSENRISIGIYDNIDVTQFNDISIENNEEKELNTGGNRCNRNVSGCEIVTGDIESRTRIENRVGDNDVEVNVPGRGQEPEPTPRPEADRPLDGAPPAAVTPTPQPEVVADIPPQGGVVPPGEEELAEEPEGEVPGEEPQAEEEEPGIIEEILERVVKPVQAAITAEQAELEKEPEVLGAMQLPITGLGYNGMGMAWGEIVWGLYLIATGLVLRRRIGHQGVTNPHRKED